MFLVFSQKRREILLREAEASRLDEALRLLSLVLVVFYNLIGVLDVISTILAIGGGRGEEANPVMQAMMSQLGPGWILGKFFLQALVSGMVLWYPHKYVLALFTPAVVGNAVVVANNFMIAMGV